MQREEQKGKERVNSGLQRFCSPVSRVSVRTREGEKERESETGERERGVRGKERAESGSGEGGKKERTSAGEIEAKERERDGARERKAKRERDFTYLHPRSLRGLSLPVDETKRCEARCGGKGTRELGISRSARAKGTVTIFCSFEGI